MRGDSGTEEMDMCEMFPLLIQHLVDCKISIGVQETGVG